METNQTEADGCDSDMVTHMKTTIDIAEPLLDEAKRLASEDGTTLRALVEEGLRHVVGGRRTRGEFRLRKVSFAGSGLQPEVRDGGWARLRDLAYEGQGS